MVRMYVVLACVSSLSVALAQIPEEPKPDQLKKEDKHILGIIPNYKTVPLASDKFVPLTTKEKFKLASEDSFDPFVLPINGMYAGVSHLEHQSPSWGMGAKGYFRRYGAALVDSTDGNFMTEAIFPTMLRQDPRYFRLGEGNAAKRIAYSMTRVLVARSDSGRNTVNLSELAGNFTSGAISNLYYPQEARGIWPTTRRGVQQTMYDSIFNVLKEYWPDIRQKLFKSKTRVGR